MPASPKRLEPLPQSTDVVVIGDGAVAASTAFHLAEVGAEVLMLNASAKAGAGATSPPIGVVGGVRSSDAAVLDLVVRSHGELQAFEERIGFSVGWDQQGFLGLVPLGGDLTPVRELADALTSRGLAAQVVAPDEARCPYIDPARYRGALHVPDAALVYPDLIGMFYSDAAEIRGARVRVKTAVRAIEHARGRITSVVTEAGTVRTGAVVNCDETRAGELGAMVGQRLPVQTVKRPFLYTEDVDPEPWTLFPYTTDFETSLVLHIAGEGLMFGVTGQAGPGVRVAGSRPVLEARAAAGDRLPALATADTPHGGPSRTFDETPDGLPLIGRAHPVQGFAYAVGFGGDGFAYSPAAGQLARDLVLGREPFADVAGLSADRFEAPRRRRRWFGTN